MTLGVVSAQIPDDSPVETEFKDLDFYSLCTRLSLFPFLLSTLLSLLSTTRADLLSSTTRSSIVKTFRFSIAAFLYLVRHGKVWCYVCLGNFANRSGGLSLLYTRCWKYKHRLLVSTEKGWIPSGGDHKLRHRGTRNSLFLIGSSMRYEGYQLV